MRIRFEKQKDRDLVDAYIYVQKDECTTGWHVAEGKNNIDALQNLCICLADALREEIKLSNKMYKKLKSVSRSVRDYE